MKIKNISLLTIISLCNIPAYGMNKQVVSSSRSITQKKANAQQSKNQLLLDKITTHIVTANADNAYTLFNSSEITKLTEQEKKELYTYAKKYNNQFLAIACKHDDPAQWDEDQINTLINREHIVSGLRLLKVLPDLYFPQALFTNAQRYRTPPVNKTPDQALLALIKNEEDKISVCCFYLDLETIAAKLIRKKENGVKVKVITTQKQGNTNTLQQLADNGITVLAPQNDAFETNHHKFAIFKNNLFNKNILCLGSFNYTNSAIQRNWEDMTIEDNTRLIAQYKEQFNAIKKCSTKPKFLKDTKK